ncbi:MAG TPA: hypothetical protein ENN60_02880, partial [archaeon]|nr:hypothetical protein [archaeon]
MTESTSEAESISEAIAKFNIQLDYSGTKAESSSEAESISEAIAKFNIQLDYSGTKAESTSKATVKYPTLYT